jgi:predicted secreted protein
MSSTAREILMSNRSIVLLLLCVFSWSVGLADEAQGPTHNRVALSVDASDEIDNDLLVATLGIQREGSRAATLADEVNRAVNWALAEARKHAMVKVQTQSYQTRPIYRNNTLSGWRVSQSIRLESKEATDLSELIARLQERLALQSIGFEVSDETRRTENDALIKEALKRFRERAAMITEQLGRRSYRIIQVDVNTHGVQPMPMVRGMAMHAEAAVATPQFEAGSQTLRVSVSGQIEVSEE